MLPNVVSLICSSLGCERNDLLVPWRLSERCLGSNVLSCRFCIHPRAPQLYAKLCANQPSFILTAGSLMSRNVSTRGQRILLVRVTSGSEDIKSYSHKKLLRRQRFLCKLPTPILNTSTPRRENAQLSRYLEY